MLQGLRMPKTPIVPEWKGLKKNYHCQSSIDGFRQLSHIFAVACLGATSPFLCLSTKRWARLLQVRTISFFGRVAVIAELIFLNASVRGTLSAAFEESSVALHLVGRANARQHGKVLNWYYESNQSFSLRAGPFTATWMIAELNQSFDCMASILDSCFSKARWPHEWAALATHLSLVGWSFFLLLVTFSPFGLLRYCRAIQSCI